GQRGDVAIQVQVVGDSCMAVEGNPGLDDAGTQPDVVVVLLGIAIRRDDAVGVALREANEVGGANFLRKSQANLSPRPFTSLPNPSPPGALRELARPAARLRPGTGWPVVVEFRDPLTGQRHPLRLLPPDEGTPPAVEGDAPATHGDYPPGELPPMAA